MEKVRKILFEQEKFKEFLKLHELKLPVDIILETEQEAGMSSEWEGTHNILIAENDSIAGHTITLNQERSVEWMNISLIHEVCHAMQAEQFQTASSYLEALESQRALPLATQVYPSEKSLFVLTNEELKGEDVVKANDNTPWEKEALEFEKHSESWEFFVELND